MGCGPGRFAPAGLFLVALAAALPSPTSAQRRQAAPAPAAAPLPTPDRITVLKLLWGTMAAVDQANRTGNYSVLRDLGSGGFQTNNNPATLGAAFATIRGEQVDVSDALFVTPTWEIAPAMVDPRTLRMRGSFPLRPREIAFDLLFFWDNGWRLHGIAVQSQASRSR